MTRATTMYQAIGTRRYWKREKRMKVWVGSLILISIPLVLLGNTLILLCLLAVVMVSLILVECRSSIPEEIEKVTANQIKLEDDPPRPVSQQEREVSR